jgi:hypothetical protein
VNVKMTVKGYSAVGRLLLTVLLLRWVASGSRVALVIALSLGFIGQEVNGLAMRVLSRAIGEDEVKQAISEHFEAWKQARHAKS